VADALTHLVAHGLVLREDHPPSASFLLNRDHIAAGIAELLGELKDALRQRCASEIASWAYRPLWAALFGSVVRSEGDASSDIDLVLVLADGSDVHAPHWMAQLDHLAERVQAWTGNDASIVTFTRAEFRASHEPMVSEITREGITLYGRRPGRSAK